MTELEARGAISWDRRLRAAESVLFRELDGEAVLLELDSGKYFGLDEVGTRFWSVLVDSDRLEQAVPPLLAEFEVDEARLRPDLLEFVETLMNHGLAELVEASGE